MWSMSYDMKECNVKREEERRFTYRASRLRFLWSELQLDGELPDELSEEVLVAVLGELVHHEPVRHLTLGQDVLQALRHVLVVLMTDLLGSVRDSLMIFDDVTVLKSW